MRPWIEDIVTAFENLGGIAGLSDLYAEIKQLRTNLPESYEASIRAYIETHSSDSKRFKGKDLFYSVEGVSHGVWGLRRFLKPTPVANDIEPPSTQKVLVQIYRVLRDTKLVRDLKQLHRNRCQICDETILLGSGSEYSEGHHIRPLGAPHGGPDIPENVLILCPNHHVQCDYQAMPLTLDMLRLHPDNSIGQRFLDYHNALIGQGDTEDQVVAAAPDVEPATS